MGGGFPGGGGFRTTNPVAPSHGTGAAARPGGFGAVGMIKSLGDGTMAVAVTPRAVGGASAPATSTRTVTWTAATTFTQVVPATSSAVAVGVCVVAQGATDTTGALTAKSIAVSQPVNGTCSAGFGGRRGGYGQGGTGSNG